MKTKLLIVSMLSAFISTAFAAQSQINQKKNPFYIGISSGYSRTYYNSSYLRHSTSVGDIDKTGLALRIDGGYKLNDHFATELGITELPKIKFNKVRYGRDSLTASFHSVAIDLTEKASVRYKHVTMFARGGVALMHRYDGKASFNYKSQKSRLHPKNRIIPAVGAGISYAITHDVNIDLADMAYIGKHKMPTANIILAGLSYNFS